MTFNGPGRELSRGQDHCEESVYCVRCGTIYVPAGTRRDCPTCTLAEMVKSIGDRVEKLNREANDMQEGDDSAE